jgi:hypothetical protein
MNFLIFLSMNKRNDKGERHGYWELFYVNKNYCNGIKHGKYEYYYDKGKTRLNQMGQYNMGRRVGYWERIKANLKIIEKEFYL